MFSRIVRKFLKALCERCRYDRWYCRNAILSSGEIHGKKITIHKESSDDVSFLGIMAGALPALAGGIVGATVVAPIPTTYICGTRYRFHLNLVELKWLIVYGIPLLKSYPKSDKGMRPFCWNLPNVYILQIDGHPVVRLSFCVIMMILS